MQSTNMNNVEIVFKDRDGRDAGFKFEVLMLPAVKAMCKHRLYEEVDSGPMSLESARSFLDKYRIPYDADPSESGFQFVRKEGPGTGLAKVRSFDGKTPEAVYDTHFPLIESKGDVYEMLKRFYWCNCEYGRSRERRSDVPVCIHLLYSVVSGRGEKMGMDDLGVKMLVSGLVNNLNANRGRMDASKFYQKFEDVNSAFKKILMDRMSKFLNSYA